MEPALQLITFIVFDFSIFQIKDVYEQIMEDSFEIKIFSIITINNKLLFNIFTGSFSFFIVFVQTDLSW